MKNKWTQQWKSFRDEAKKIWDELARFVSPGSVNSQQVNVKWNDVAGQWEQFRIEAKQQWGELTDSELKEVNGRFDVLVEKIQERYGIEREAATKQIASWANTLNVY